MLFYTPALSAVSAASSGTAFSVPPDVLPAISGTDNLYLPDMFSAPDGSGCSAVFSASGNSGCCAAVAVPPLPAPLYGWLVQQNYPVPPAGFYCVPDSQHHLSAAPRLSLLPELFSLLLVFLRNTAGICFLPAHPPLHAAVSWISSVSGAFWHVPASGQPFLTFLLPG